MSEQGHGGQPPGGDPPPSGGHPPHAPKGEGYAQPPGQADPGGGTAAAARTPGAQAVAASGDERIKWVVAGGGAVVVVLVILLIVVLASGGGPSTLPFAAGHLPDETERVSLRSLRGSLASSYGLRPDELPEEAYWSALAHLACGGHDLFDDLMDGAMGDAEDAADAVRRDVDAYEASLACGKELAESMGEDGGIYRVAFADGDDKRHVTLVDLGVEEIPESVDALAAADDAEPSNMGHTRCMLPWKSADADCSDRSRAIARLETTGVWAMGRLEDLDAFGSAYAPEGDHDEEAIAAMVAIGDELSDHDRRRFGVADGFYPPGNSFLYVRASADREQAEALKEAVEEGAVAWGLGSTSRTGIGEAKLVIVAGSEKKAKDIGSRLESYLSSLGEAVEEREDEEGEKERDDDEPDALVSWMKAKVAMSRRAFEKTELEVDGDRVVLTAVEEPTDEDEEKLEAFHEWRNGHAELVAEIVRGYASGEAPSDDDLDAIDEEINELLELPEWDHPPKYLTKGFFVPGGFDETKRKRGRREVEVRRWDGLSREDFLAIVEKINEKKGWSLERKDDSVLIATKDDEELSFVVGEKDGAATLIQQ